MLSLSPIPPFLHLILVIFQAGTFLIYTVQVPLHIIVFFLSLLFINRFKSESSSASLLKRVLHPKIYQAALDGCKQLQEEGIVTTFEPIVIKSHTLVEIRVHVAEDKEGRE